VRDEMMNDEERAKDIQERHRLTSLHLFTSDMPSLAWRVFASRRDPKGYEASCESGGGMTIRAALESLDERLTAGPINKPYVPFLDPESKAQKQSCD
jgi:hypothetical protein